LNEKPAGKLLSAFEVQNQIISLQYRLLNVQDGSNNILTECLRLSMLGFFLTMSMFQSPTVKADYPYLAKRFRECCELIRTSQINCGDIMMWALMIGAVVVFDVMDPWLHEIWEAEVRNQLTWGEARRRLQDVLWINEIHDIPGQEAFTILNLKEKPNLYVKGLGNKQWAKSWAGCGYEFLS
jgi:hypothetical protein